MGNKLSYRIALFVGLCLLLCDHRVVCDTCSANSSHSEQCISIGKNESWPKVLIATLVLPDGLGDIFFGECAAAELVRTPAAVTWIRVYPSEEVSRKAEALLSEASAISVVNSRVFSSYDAFASHIDAHELDSIWGESQEVFLAPWIFGIANDQSLLAMAKRVGRRFWAMSEYGRGMGHIHSYSDGLGSRIPTGWPQGSSDELNGGVFKTILHAPHEGRDWKAHFAALIGVQELFPDVVQSSAAKASDTAGVMRFKARLWWAYGRQDSSTTHEFRVIAGQRHADGAHWPEVAKVIPVADDGSLATGNTKTTGELLKDQVDALMEDPNHKANIHITAPSETAAHVAGQISQLIVHILTQDRSGEDENAVEIIVAPNVGIEALVGAQIVRITSLELMSLSGKKTVLSPARPVFLVVESIPRHEMRAFLEQCEDAVVATGDQSVAEAILLGKVPMTKPDAKVGQWELALSALAKGAVNSVPDLGEVLRNLLTLAEERDRFSLASKSHSALVESSMVAEMGQKRSETQELLARAGMFG